MASRFENVCVLFFCIFLEILSGFASDLAKKSGIAVVSGGAEGTLAPPEFGSSINPIPTGGGRLRPPQYY